MANVSNTPNLVFYPRSPAAQQGGLLTLMTRCQYKSNSASKATSHYSRSESTKVEAKFDNGLLNDLTLVLTLTLY